MRTTFLPRSAQTSAWTPARSFLLVAALYHIPLGIIGLAIDQTFPLAPDAAASAAPGYIFGVFETNGWHSLAGVLIGVVSLLFTLRPRRAREVALAIGIGHVVVVAALFLWDPSIFLLASNDADQVTHASTAVGGIACALLTPAGVTARRR